jgi:hypothetical protein
VKNPGPPDFLRPAEVHKVSEFAPWRPTKALRSDLIDPTIAAHNDRVVKRTGDGSIVEFRSVVDAVRCAIEVQNTLIERRCVRGPPHRIPHRHSSGVRRPAQGLSAAANP